MTRYFTNHERRALLLYVLILLAFTIIGSSSIYVVERQERVKNASLHFEEDVERVNRSLAEAFYTGDSDTVKQFIQQWGQEHPDLVEMRLTDHSGDVIATYSRSQPSQYHLPMKRLISYGGRDDVEMDFIWDLAPIYASLNRLLLMIVAIHIALVTALILFTWWVLRRTLLEPLRLELEDSERYNRMLFEQSPIGLALYRMNGELVDVNATYAQIIGHTVEDTLQLSYWDITPKSYAAEEQRQLDCLNSTGHYGPYEKEYIHKDGHRVSVRLQGQLLEKGDEQYIWSSVEDVTELNHLMQILRSLAVSSTSMLTFEHFLQNALTSLTEFYGCQYAFVGQLQPDGKHVRTLAVRAREQPAENFEYNLEGTPCQDILDLKLELVPRDASRLYADDKMLVDMGVESYYGSPLMLNDNSMMGLISVMDTKPMEVDIWSEPLLKVFSSRIALELERLNSDQALIESELRFRQLTENINEVFWLGSPDWNEVLYVSPAYEKHWGQSTQTLYDNPRAWMDAVHPDDRAQVLNDIPKSTDEIEEFVNFHEYRIQKPDGSILWIKARVYPIRDDKGEIIRVAGIAEDITVRKLAEKDLLELNSTLEDRITERTLELEEATNKANAANLAKSEFLSNMSHEIRSPLASIIGFSESLQIDDHDEQERERITSTIVRNSKHLQQVVNNILDLSKIEANQLEAEQIKTSVFLLMSEVDSLMGMSAREKGLEFRVNYHFPLPEYIVTDPTCLKQILMNLCSNAIKFTDDGFVEVDVSYDNDVKQMQIVVSDSGIGMSSEETARVFEPFTQADTTTTRKYGGTGLGLSISDKLAHALGGKLSCESEKGQGSRFTLTVTNHDRAIAKTINHLSEISIHHDEQRYLDEIKRLNGSILLAEDGQDNQQLIAMYIRKTGADLTIVNNGEQAIDEALTNEFDLILMDMQMPVMGGIEAITRLRESGYKKPIATLTANAMLTDREKSKAAGADEFLNKPIDLYQFYQVLNKYLEEDTRITNNDYIHTLQQQINDNPQYKALVNRFVTNLPAMIKELRSALDDKDWTQLQERSHELKGLGSSMGYPEITEKAGIVNTLVKQDNYKQLAHSFAELENYCRRLNE